MVTLNFLTNTVTPAITLLQKQLLLNAMLLVENAK